eukprot:3477389-Pyramimonas_sp.AAC.1
MLTPSRTTTRPTTTPAQLRRSSTQSPRSSKRLKTGIEDDVEHPDHGVDPSGTGEGPAHTEHAEDHVDETEPQGSENDQGEGLDRLQ